MATNVSECVTGAINLIESELDGLDVRYDFGEYSLIYSKTNEDIAAYLGHFDLSHYYNALTVLSSGDHAFNLVQKGILNIDTFDTNKLTEFFALGLKRAMIMKYSYGQYLKALNHIANQDYKLGSELALITDLLPYMDKDYRDFWKEIIDYAFKNRKKLSSVGLFKLLTRNDYSPNEYNSFLQSKEDYNLLRERLGKANISFSCFDAINIDKNVSSEYDIIMLSNILNFFYMFYNDWNYSELQEYEKKIQSILTPKGIAFINYIYYYREDGAKKDFIINGSSITPADYNSNHELILPFRRKEHPETESAVLVLTKNDMTGGEL